MPQGPFNSLIGKVLGATSYAPLQFGKQSEAWTTDRHPRDYAANYQKGVAFAANQAGTTTSAGLATTYTGLCLSNPAASTKNLVLLRASGSFLVAPSTITGINLIQGYSAAGVVTHTTPLTVYSGFVGGTTTYQGLADAACTIVGTPIYTFPLAQASTATTAPYFSQDFGGAIIIPPGGYAAIGTTIASPASSFIGAIYWAEETP